MTTGQFVLQVVGITDATLLSWPAKEYPSVKGLSNIKMAKDNKELIVHTPSHDCDGLVLAGIDILVAPCPPDEYDDDVVSQMNGKPFTHTIFLSVWREINLNINDGLNTNGGSGSGSGKRVPAKPLLYNKTGIIIEPPIQTDDNTNPQPTANTNTNANAKVDDDDDDDDDEPDDDDDNEQFIAVNPKIAIEVMESAIEKNLMKALPPVKQFKRNIEIKLEGRVDSTFTFVGFCTDGIPFAMEVQNVPYAEYNHGNKKKEGKFRFNSKTAYFPGKSCTEKATAEMIKKIKDLTRIKLESVTRCLLGYVIERTDIDRFEFSAYNNEYRAAVKYAVENGVDVVPLVVSWTKEGVAFYVTDELPVVYPTV
jgi:DNA-binding sugar fermentation-stimulating protein